MTTATDELREKRLRMTRVTQELAEMSPRAAEFQEKTTALMEELQGAVVAGVSASYELQILEVQGLKDAVIYQKVVEEAEDALAALTAARAGFPTRAAEFQAQAERFPVLLEKRSFLDFRQAMDELAEQGLAFRARRDPKQDLSEGAIVLLEKGGVEIFYAPLRRSIISQESWSFVTDAYKQLAEASRERREHKGRERKEIESELQEYRDGATPGLTPYRAVHEETEGVIYLVISYNVTRPKIDGTGKPVTDGGGKPVFETTDQTRTARMRILVRGGKWTIKDGFGPDRIDWIVRWARRETDEGVKLRWFPLYPPSFDPTRVTWVIANVVWPALERWYETEAGRRQEQQADQDVISQSLAIQDRSEISPIQLRAGEPGLCGILIRGAKKNGRGPDDLTLSVRGTGKGTFLLEEYLSRYGVFDLEAILGLEFSLEEIEGGVLPEWQKLAGQSQIVRDVIQLAADWQRSDEIQAKWEDPKIQRLLVTVAEGLVGKTGYSIFHIPRAQTESRGPAHLTCRVQWLKTGYRLKEYVSWAVPWEWSNGPFELDEAIGELIPRQPAKGEEPVIQVVRHILEERKRYDLWRAFQWIGK